jgi:hypothetical protein
MPFVILTNVSSCAYTCGSLVCGNQLRRTASRDNRASSPDMRVVQYALV